MMLVDVKLTDHFSLSEFACGGGAYGCACHGCGALVERDLVFALEEMRQATGHPLVVNSGFRCDSWNAHERVGGDPRSFHRVGRAADVTSWLIRREIETWARSFADILLARIGEDRGNVIVYPKRGFVHVDVGHRVGGGDILRENLSEPKARGW